jgi:hypothetical protein
MDQNHKGTPQDYQCMSYLEKIVNVPFHVQDVQVEGGKNPFTSMLETIDTNDKQDSTPSQHSFMQDSLGDNYVVK